MKSKSSQKRNNLEYLKDVAITCDYMRLHAITYAFKRLLSVLLAELDELIDQNAL